MYLLKRFYWVPLMCLFLAASSLITYYPHLDYHYPIHIDEWEHFAMAEEATIIGKTPGYFPVFEEQGDAGTMKWERNYHTFLSILFSILPFPHELTMTFVPVIVSVLMYMSSFLLLFYLTKSKPVSLFGAFLTSLIKSNITALGPWFAVPASAGLAFLPFLLYLFLNTFHRDKMVLLLFSGLSLASVAMMNPHIVIVVPIFAIYMLSKPGLLLKKARYILLAILILFGILIAFIPSVLTDPYSGIQQLLSFMSFGQELIETKFNVFTYVGYIPFFISIIGFFFAVRAHKKKEWILACFFGLLAVLIYIYTNYDIMFFMLYRRGFLFLVQSIFLLATFAVFRMGELVNREQLRYVIYIVLFSLIIFEPITSFSLYSNLMKHYITDDDYQNILWMRDNLPDDAVVLATPEVSSAIYPIAHKFVADYAFSPKQELERLLQNPCSYESIRSYYGITHVYSPGSVCSKISLIDNHVYEYV